MKRNFPKIINSFLIPIVSLAAILCCNLSVIRTAQAGHSVAVAETEKLPPCHRQQKTESPAKKDCTCCIQKKVQADLPAKFSLVPQSFDYLAVSVLAQPVALLKDDFILLYLNGPPGPTSDIPLYIRLRNFRI